MAVSQDEPTARIISLGVHGLMINQSVERLTVAVEDRKRFGDRRSHAGGRMNLKVGHPQHGHAAPPQPY